MLQRTPVTPFMPGLAVGVGEADEHVSLYTTESVDVVTCQRILFTPWHLQLTGFFGQVGSQISEGVVEHTEIRLQAQQTTTLKYIVKKKIMIVPS